MGEGNGNPLQCSCLENPRDGGAWWAAVYGVAQSRTRLKRLGGGSSSMPPRFCAVPRSRGASGREELPGVSGRGRLPRGATPRPRSGAAAARSNLTTEERQLRGHRRTETSYSTFKVMRGDLVQGKEQRLRFAGAAVKRYPTSEVRETQVRG